MKPIEEKERYTLSKIVSDNLRQYIIEKKLKTGEKLPAERELAKMMEVSRVMIREALRSLESTGIIVIRHGEGAFVNTNDSSVILNHLLYFWKLNNDKMNELLELRHVLEKAAIEQIILSAKVDHLKELENIIDRMKETSDTKKFQEYDIEFHSCLIKATENDLFAQLTDIIAEYFSSISHSQMDQAERNKTVNEHQLIVEAVKQKNKQLALQILKEHLEYSKKYILIK
ncbi:FadR family transcriptional regulator [Paenibacillus alkaliterrae]|uniref:FadR/GntR family transcriptional regulator n=1 Tax=Paenibacillus alkaliterrae TaxID=320909 RepID=UPI001F185CC4|nr:FadR/GntR family transcriptional regulator [Paenibacillus alkaliterrae]MCF2939228.1 FadR family transcriptional regulator [Paenibacillus alkaliterrae]